MRVIPYYISLFLLLFVAAVPPAWAQTQQVTFAESSWSFGDVKEDGGEVEHTFVFTNTTSKPVVILEVTTGCGCTTPSYSRRPVMSGQRGEITVVFNPMNMPGRFTKSASVLTSASSKPVTLSLEGNVIPRKKSVQEMYPFDLGDGLRLAVNAIDFAYVERGGQVQERVEWVNTSSKDVALRLLRKEQSGVLQVSAPAVAKAGEKGEITLTYKIPVTSGRYGTLNDVFGFSVNGREARVILSVTAIAVDRYDRMAEGEELPSGEVSKKIIKFGDVKRGQRAEDATLEITNEGGSDLIIRAVEWQNGALKCSLKAGDRVPAGGRVAVRMTLDSGNCDYGAWIDRLKIITNDPVRPMHSVRVTAIVVD